jgi:hypothetical protein
MQRRNKLLNFLDWGRKIGIGKEQIFPACMQKSLPNAETFAPVLAILQEIYRGCMAAERRNNLGRRIA